MKYFIYIVFAIFIWSCSSDSEDYAPVDDQENQTSENADLAFTTPSNFPDPTYDITQNQPTEKGFELGKKLFYDGKLASDGVVSCGFCHIQDFGFTHHTHITSHGVDGKIGKRNAQPLFNLAYMEEFTWDGAAVHLDSQPIIPLTAEVEMNETVSNVLRKLSEDPNYPAMFEAAYGTNEITAERMFKALSQFMILMISDNSKFDKLERGEAITFTDTELAGKNVFEAKCASCHAGTLQTDQSYRNNGLAIDPNLNDEGRRRVTGLESDYLKFKVPTLRNIEVTFPYMHDGRFRTLEEVLDFYTDGMVDSETLDDQFRRSDGSLGLDLSQEEKTQLIAFLKTLTDNDFLNDRRFSEF